MGQGHAIILIFKNVLVLSLLFLDWLTWLGLISILLLTLQDCLYLLSHNVLKVLASSEQTETVEAALPSFVSPPLAREAEVTDRTRFLQRRSCVLHRVNLGKQLETLAGAPPCKDTPSDKQ